MFRLQELKKETKKIADPKRAKLLQGFFKTGKGEYGEGDIFYGITVPESRKIAKKFKGLKFSDIQKLLKSKIHEERLIAILVLVHNFENGNSADQNKIYNFYLESTRYINNWDLVDLSAYKIIGRYLDNKPKTILCELAKSKSLWEKRIAIIATAWFIKNKKFGDTLKISEILLKDEHDLIHKAVGWMLREVGKRDIKTEEKFLKKHYKKMPRTMLRYAIERFPKKRRKFYLNKKP